LIVDCEAFGCLRRGMNITVLFKQKSKEIEGEFLGRLVLGVEGEDIKVTSFMDMTACLIIMMLL